MSSPHVAQAAQAIRKTVEKHVARNSSYLAEGRGIASGRAVIRSDPQAVIDDAETYGIIVPGAPTPGGDAVMLLVDGKEYYLGMVNQSGTSTFAVGIGQTSTFGDQQEAADSPSTSNNAQSSGGFVNAFSLTWNMSSPVPLPDGIYDFTVEGDFLAGHSANDHVQFRVSAGGVVGGAMSINALSTIMTRLRSVRSTFTNVTVTGGITFVIEYRRDDALVGETASARNPTLLIHATRKG